MKLDFASLAKSADNIVGKIPAVKKRRRLDFVYKILKYFCWLILLLFLILLLIFFVNFISLKSIYNQAAAGKNNLEQAAAFIKSDDFSQAAQSAKAAENNFTSAVNGLNGLKQSRLVNSLPAVMSQLNGAESLLVAGQFLSKAFYNAANFGISLEAVLSGDKKLSFSKFSPEEKQKVLKKLFESAPELNGIKADLDLAYLNLNQVEIGGLFFFLKEKIGQARGQIGQARELMEKAVPLSQLIPILAGYPKEVKYLVMLENNDELRPTGGFLGTYGILHIKDGDIISFATHDIYHLDMPVQDKVNIIPPEPIKKYLNNKWYLRDANWSPDWPTSAQKINWFYQLESRLNPEAEKIDNFDGIIALTPKLITDFLKITGPIEVEGQAYNQDNFHDLLQYRVERGYQVLGVSSWQRKEVIGEIARELKVKLLDLPPAEWSKLAAILADNLETKNVLCYFSDSQLENLAMQNGWGGEIKNYYGDYLMVVDANLGALKTDAVMNRGLNYKVSQGANGTFAKLNLNYSHNGKADWRISAYKSYTRIYAPLGSQLIKISGYASEQIDSGVELGKTWFGFYLTVEQGKIKNITIEYKLPASVLSGNNYAFYLQKQPGKEINQATVDFDFLNDIKSYSPANLSTHKNGLSGLSWQGDLNTDRSFEINF